MKRIIFKITLAAVASCLYVSVFPQQGIAVNPHLMSKMNCPVPAQPGVITLSATSVFLNGTFTASINAVGGATGYSWSVPSGVTIQSGQGSTSVTLKATSSGTIASGKITVYASNDCGNGSPRLSSTAVTVLSCSGAPATPGAITISPATVTAGGTFTASISTVSGATSYEWTYPSGKGLSGSSTGTSITLTTSTATTISSGTITVKAVNSCGKSAAKVSITVVTVSESGYTIANGVFTGPTSMGSGTNGITMSQLTGNYNFSAAKKNLLLYPNDLSGGYSGRYKWSDAKTACANLGSGWRLPNIAELGNLQANRSVYGLADGTYWSITERDATTAWSWDYSYNNTYWGYSAGTTNTIIRVRCVKTL